MTEYKDHCCGCISRGLPCMGDACRNKRVKMFYCDKCGSEEKTLYKYDDEQLCKECLLEMFDVVEDD